MPGRLYEATGGRFFAAIYDKLMASTEEAGLADNRRRLLANARGATLELGAGTGGNLEHYPGAVTELVLTEPSEHMAKRLRAKVSASGREAQVILAPAERLPFEDDRFDTVVGTLMLCTADEPRAVLDEVARVLRPGGQLLFLEHVRSDKPGLARWQDRLEKPWGYFGAGCHPNRDTRATIEASGLQIDDIENGELPKAPPLVRPLISGRATRPQA
jgi:ubiquinone/menaquinone biosynthesis C-methylase UbiE